MQSTALNHESMVNSPVFLELSPQTSELSSPLQSPKVFTIKLPDNMLAIANSNVNQNLFYDECFDDNSFNDYQIDSSKSVHSNKRKSVKKSKFTEYEDKYLCILVMKYGENNWKKIASEIPNRTARQCRDRYRHYLCPTINQASWTKEEDQVLLEQTQKIGLKWKLLEKYFNNRNEIQIRNRYYNLSIIEKRKQLFNSMQQFEFNSVQPEDDYIPDLDFSFDDNDFFLNE